MKKGNRSHPGIDYVTIFIVLAFMAMALGVFFYYRDRINAIREELRQTSFHVDRGSEKITANL